MGAGVVGEVACGQDGQEAWGCYGGEGGGCWVLAGRSGLGLGLGEGDELASCDLVAYVCRGRRGRAGPLAWD